MNDRESARDAIEAALKGGAPSTQARSTAGRGKYPLNRDRVPVQITLDPGVYAEGKAAAKDCGFSSFSRYVEALLKFDDRPRQKSPSAYGLVPIVRIGEAAAGALFAVRDALSEGRSVNPSLIGLLQEIRHSAHALLKAGVPAYEADLDHHFKFVYEDDWQRADGGAKN